jgi:hypothetical protein
MALHDRPGDCPLPGDRSYPASSGAPAATSTRSRSSVTPAVGQSRVQVTESDGPARRDALAACSGLADVDEFLWVDELSSEASASSRERCY